MRKRAGQMKQIKAWQWIVLGIVSLAVLTLAFFHAHWFSYRLGASHLENEIIYPFLAALILLPPTVLAWVLTKAKQKNPFLAMLVSILFVGAVLCIFGGFNGGCPVCSYPPDRVYQWLRTQFLGSPLIATW